jgi:membrane protein involved in colicin uptake
VARDRSEALRKAERRAMDDHVGRGSACGACKAGSGSGGGDGFV